jgi:hypothetical protein
MNISFYGERVEPLTCKVYYKIDEAFDLADKFSHNTLVPLSLYNGKGEVNHSPTGFEWGYYGSGPSQLSYAILRKYYEYVGFEQKEAIELAKRRYMWFKQDAIATIPRDMAWHISETKINEWHLSRGLD